MAPLDHAQGPVDLRQQAGDRRLPGAGVAGEDQVAALVGDRQAPLQPDLLDAQQVGDEAHLALDRVQADEGVELGQQVLDLAGGRQRIGHRGGLRPVGRRGASGRRPALVLDAPDRRVADGPTRHGPELVDGLELGRGRQQVDGRHDVADLGAEPGVADRAVTTVTSVGRDEHAEQRRRLAKDRAPSDQQAGVAQVRRRGPAELGGHAVTEDRDQIPQLVVAVALVGVDEPAGQVVGVDHDVRPQPADVEAGDVGGQLLDGGQELVDERVHRLVERRRVGRSSHRTGIMSRRTGRRDVAPVRRRVMAPGDP